METTKENLFTTDRIRTHSGKYIDVFNPDLSDILIEDIAHGLSHVCRFAGHTQSFYSVAQHSIEMCLKAPEKDKIAALLHDASETYFGDIPSPIKKYLPDYQKLEHNFMLKVAEKFEFQFPLSNQIKFLDKNELILEWDSYVLQNYSPKIGTEIVKQYFIELYETYKNN